MSTLSHTEIAWRIAQGLREEDPTLVYCRSCRELFDPAKLPASVIMPSAMCCYCRETLTIGLATLDDIIVAAIDQLRS